MRAVWNFSLIAAALAGCDDQGAFDMSDISSRDAIAPGRWETKFADPGAEYDTDGFAKKSSSGRTRCISQYDIDSSLITVLVGPVYSQCDEVKAEISGGIIDVVAQCKKGRTMMDLSIKGSYDQEHFKYKQTLSFDSGQIESSVSADKVGECTR